MANQNVPKTDNLAQWNDEMFEKHPTPYNGLAGYVEKKRAQAIISEIKKHKTRNNFHLLEIGCEAGNLINILMKEFPEAQFYGHDISQIALDEAKKRLGDNVQLQQSDITSSTFVGDINIPELDFIVCSETLEHVPEAEKGINNIEKLSQKGQHVIITVPYEKTKEQLKSFFTKIGLFNLLFKEIEEGFSEWHVQDFSKEDLHKLFSVDFEILKYKNLYQLHQILVLRKK